MVTPCVVTDDEIEHLLDEATMEDCIFWGKELVVSYRLKCGFSIAGRAACIDPANFILETGRRIARENAKRQLWQLEGYRKQNELCKYPRSEDAGLYPRSTDWQERQLPL